MREVVIVSGARTAIGNFGGALQDIPAAQLEAVAIKAAMVEAPLICNLALPPWVRLPVPASELPTMSSLIP